MLRELRKRIDALTPYKKWELLYSSANSMMTVLGINTANDCTRNWRTPISMIVFFFLISCQLCTMWKYWQENKITAIEPLTVTPIMVQVISILLLQKCCLKLDFIAQSYAEDTNGFRI